MALGKGPKLSIPKVANGRGLTMGVSAVVGCAVREQISSNCHTDALGSLHLHAKKVNNSQFRWQRFREHIQ